ncbi:MAG: D-alanine--D-alanine ligase [Desulfobacteraceae bacterium]|nr:MAG: D-alanine--D-alanine ligase [Desulfobacteraceae bacterium]
MHSQNRKPSGKTVAVLHDWVHDRADPDHADVLVQTQAVSEALAELGYNPIEMDFSLDLKACIKKLQDLNPLFVFNLVESTEQQGRLIYFAPALLDSLRRPYTGSRTDAIYITTNKFLTKQLFAAWNIPAPRGFLPDHLRANLKFSGEPYIVKSLWEHASVGLNEDSVVCIKNALQLKHAMTQRQSKLGGECFAEEYIEGREFNLGLLAGPDGPQVLPPAEIRFVDFPEGKRRLVDYRAKWEEHSFEYTHTPRSFDFPAADRPLLENLIVISKKCWELFDLHGYARVDFRVDKENNPFVLEINANPCLSPDAGFFAAAQQAGLDMPRIVERIIADMKRDFLI